MLEMQWLCECWECGGSFTRCCSPFTRCSDLFVDVVAQLGYVVSHLKDVMTFGDVVAHLAKQKPIWMRVSF